MSILNVGATEHYTSIASAVSAARSGDTILIDAGTYKAQDILLTKNLAIEAAGNGPVVLQESRPLAKGMLIAGSSRGCYVLFGGCPAIEGDADSP